MNLLLNGPKGGYVIVDYVILVLAVILNCFVLQGIIKAKFNLAGYRRFLISLVISELYVCAVNLALFMFEILTWYYPNSFGNHCESHVLRSFQLVGFFANLLSLLGMTVDHFIGIVYPLKYRSWMNTTAARTAVCIIWVTSVILGFADMPVATVKYLSQKSTANNKPAVCSGNVISDIVDILESSDFLTANHQLLFNNNEASRLKQAANAAANGFAGRRNGTELFGNVGGNASVGDYSSYNGNYYNPALSDPALYPFLFLAHSENYYEDRLREARSVATRSKVKKNKTRSSGVKRSQKAATFVSNGTKQKIVTTVTLTTPAMTSDNRKISFSSSFKSSSPVLSSVLFNAQNMTTTATPKTTVIELSTTAVATTPSTSTMTTISRRIVQSPENEVALCEALIKAQTKMDDHGWCSQYGSDPWLEVCIMSLTAFCFIFFTFCYGKIFRKVFVEAEFKRHKTSKMVVTTCLLLSTFAICYMPFMLYEFFMMWYDDAAQVQSSTTFLLIHNVFNSLLLSYPLFDPIIFVARSPPVMRNVLEQFSCLFSCCPAPIQDRLQQLTAHASGKYSTASDVSRNNCGGPGAGRNNSYRLSTRRHSGGTNCSENSTTGNNTTNNSTNAYDKSAETLFSRNNKRQPVKTSASKFAGNDKTALSSAADCYLTEVDPVVVVVKPGMDGNNSNGNGGCGYIMTSQAMPPSPTLSLTHPHQDEFGAVLLDNNNDDDDGFYGSSKK